MNLKKKWIAGLILLGVLLVGLFLGSAGTLLVLNKKVEKRPPSSFAMKHERVIDKVMLRMEEKLGLTEEQSKLIKPEIISMGNAFRTLHEETSEQMDVLVEAGKQAVLSHLTPEQAEIYERDIATRHFRMRSGPPRDGGRDKKWSEHSDRKMRKHREFEDDVLAPPPPPPSEE